MPHQGEWIQVGDRLSRTCCTESDASQLYLYRARLNRTQEVAASKMSGDVLGFVNLIFQQEVMLFPTNPLSDGFGAVTFIAPSQAKKLTMP